MSVLEYEKRLFECRTKFGQSRNRTCSNNKVPREHNKLTAFKEFCSDTTAYSFFSVDSCTGGSSAFADSSTGFSGSSDFCSVEASSVFSTFSSSLFVSQLGAEAGILKIVDELWRGNLPRSSLFLFDGLLCNTSACCRYIWTCRSSRWIWITGWRWAQRHYRDK